MSEPFLSEIKIVSFGFPPKGWAFCNGQLLPIQQNQGLFSLLGTVYGGDGRVNFGLPNLQGRVPMHEGQGHVLGELAGKPAHTLGLSEMPLHPHIANGTNSNASTNVPTGNVLARGQAGSNPLNYYASPPANQTFMNQQGIGIKGNSQPHENRQPFLVLNFIIALQGIYPSQN